MEPNEEFNKDDLLKHLYGEMEEGEGQDLLQSLCEDEKLFEEYVRLSEAREYLEGSELNPAEYSCEKILHYVKTTGNEKSKETSNGRVIDFKNPVFFVVACTLCFSLLSAGMVTMSQKVKNENLFLGENPHLEWNSSLIDGKMKALKNKMVNIQPERKSVLPFRNNTYKVVNLNSVQSERATVTLVRLK